MSHELELFSFMIKGILGFYANATNAAAVDVQLGPKGWLIPLQVVLQLLGKNYFTSFLEKESLVLAGHLLLIVKLHPKFGCFLKFLVREGYFREVKGLIREGYLIMFIIIVHNICQHMFL